MFVASGGAGNGLRHQGTRGSRGFSEHVEDSTEDGAK